MKISFTVEGSSAYAPVCHKGREDVRGRLQGQLSAWVEWVVRGMLSTSLKIDELTK